LNTSLQYVGNLSYVRIGLAITVGLSASTAVLSQASSPARPSANSSVSPSNSAQGSCERLMKLELPHVTITAAHVEAAGTVQVAPSPPMQAPARCIVQAISHPTTDSNINIQVWLPVQGWNKRYQQIGNAGWAGIVQTPWLALANSLGYAAASTDDGHQGGLDAAFVIGHPEKLTDFGYRALRETTETAKAVIAAFYGEKPAHSYFNGCSDGGREAMMEAQRFPEDFDGILAGAPAADWSGLTTGHLWISGALMATPDSAIPLTKLPAIQAAAVAACDDKDGLRDGLVSNPQACHFDPAVLACKGADSPGCLTKPQVDALAKMYAGPKNPTTGAQMFPGLEAGTEATTWPAWVIADAPPHTLGFFFGMTYYTQAVYEGTPWSLQTMDFDKDVAYGKRKVGSVIDATNPDLRTFRDHGGKLIQYHGWGDAGIAPISSVDYYEKAGAFLAKYPDPRNDKAKAQSDFYRLFLIPGMGHCFSGNGPVNFGQFGATNDAGRGDPERDVLAALVRWVETGAAPDRLIGTGPAPGDPSKQITRPLYPYPAVTHYNGQGDPNDPANYTGVKP